MIVTILRQQPRAAALVLGLVYASSRVPLRWCWDWLWQICSPGAGPGRRLAIAAR